MKSYFLAALKILSILSGISAVIYIGLSWANPHIVEIIVGSVALGLFIGIISNVIFVVLREGIRAIPIKPTIVASCFLAIFVAVLVYSSNNPKSIRREIPVTYVVNLRAKELASYLLYSTITSVCYNDARAIFKNFKEKSPENSRKIDEILSGTVPDGFMIRFFQNFTEYLVPYLLGHVFHSPETDIDMYRKKTPKLLGIPDESITGEPRSLEYITGKFKENLFYGIEGFAPDITEIKLRLPKDAKITLERDDWLVSRFIIKNDFMEITIGVRFLYIFPGSRAWLPSSAISKEERMDSFKRYEAMIYYDVTFSKFRYGFQDMKYYEKWANDLFNTMQKKFAWGSPVLVRPDMG